METNNEIYLQTTVVKFIKKKNCRNFETKENCNIKFIVILN